MENKSPAILIIGALVALMLGFLIGSQGKEPLLQNLSSAQMESKAMMGQLMAKMDNLSGNAGGGASAVALAGLENRIAALEAKMGPIEGLLNQIKAGGQQGEQQGPPPEDFGKVYELPIGPSKVIGTQNAPVTITVFTDFECPFCSRFHDPLKEIFKEYNGKVAYIIKHFPLPFHQNARSASKAALAAGEQGKYEEMVNALFANQKSLGEEKYKELAQQIGMNVDQFMNDYKNKDLQWEQIIQSDMKLGEQSDVRGTPTFYINGHKTRARDVAGWKQEIDSILQAKGK